ncbi:MAG: molybdopterin-dependent oxidoreductase [Chloroflexi bacterium]|nr:molybdopterin-dependent oxidoreductase [Chloroflexota bacterium]
MTRPAVAPPQHEDVWVPTVCNNCYNFCPVKVRRIDGVAVKIEGNPTAFHTQGRICGKGNSGIMTLYDPYRLKAPLKRTNPEKGLDLDPGWVEITWDEAYHIIVEKLKRIREEDPNGLCVSSWNYPTSTYERLFAPAFGTRHVGHLFTGSRGMCGEANHTLSMITHCAFSDHADIEYCNYLVIAGSGLFEAWMAAVASSRIIGERREKKGMKLVVVDPKGTGAAAKADDWLPIRPGTDGALFLAWIHVLLSEANIYDAEYLKKATNAAYLVGQDRHLVRDGATGKPLVWDAVDGRAKPYDDATLKDLALEGKYEAEGKAARPAFDIFREHVRQYTPEWAAEITTIPASTIRRIAREMGEAAQIGSKIVIEGKEYPHRPVCVVGYRGLNNHTNAWTNIMSMETLNMVLGALRTPGGLQGMDTPAALTGWRIRDRLPPGPDGLVMPQVMPTPFHFPPEHIALGEFWPLSWGTHVSCLVQNDPQRFNMEGKTAKALIISCNNPMMNGQDPKVVAESLSKIPFIVDITIQADETAQFADILLPDNTYLERWNVLNMTLLGEGMMLTQPVVQPIHNTRDAMQVMIDVADRLGILTGPQGLLFWLNGLTGREALNINRKYTWKEIVAQWCKAAWDRPIEWFMEHGHNLHPVPPEKKYLIWKDRRLPFYHHWFMEHGEALRRNMEAAHTKELMGLDPEEFASAYWPLPTWEPAVVHRDDPEYDLYAISFKHPITRFTTLPATNPWLMEVAERDPYVLRVFMNAHTGRTKGISDGDWVWVESRVGKVKAQVRLTELMHSQTLGFAGTFGHQRFGNPVGDGVGAHFNSLLPLDLEHTGRNCGAMEGTAQVKVYKT